MKPLPLRFALLIIALLGIGYVLAELLYFGGLRSALAARAQQEAQLADLADRVGELRTRLAVLPPELADPGSATIAFVSESAEQSVIALQELVNNAVAAVNGTPLALQAGQIPGDQNLVRMTVLLRARFSEAALLDFVRQIELSPVPIVVETLDVQAPVAGQAIETGLDVTAVMGALHRNAV